MGVVRGSVILKTQVEQWLCPLRLHQGWDGCCWHGQLSVSETTLAWTTLQSLCSSQSLLTHFVPPKTCHQEWDGEDSHECLCDWNALDRDKVFWYNSNSNVKNHVDIFTVCVIWKRTFKVEIKFQVTAVISLPLWLFTVNSLWQMIVVVVFRNKALNALMHITILFCNLILTQTQLASFLAWVTHKNWEQQIHCGFSRLWCDEHCW